MGRRKKASSPEAERRERQEAMKRSITGIQTEKNIDVEVLFETIEAALMTAAKKRFPEVDELRVRVNRDTGEVILLDGDRPLQAIDPADFGRIGAQTVKQVLIQRLREAESEVVFGDYKDKENTIVTGTVQSFEHGTVLLNIGRAEGIIPHSEQIPTENYKVGLRLRCYVVGVRKFGNKVKITLSRTHPALVRELFEQEVPEISEHTVEIKGLVREPGKRTKVAVYSADSRVEPVGACVGQRGVRIRAIIDELGGEKIDIVRWNDATELYIRNSLAPAEVQHIEFDKRRNRARVIVAAEQLSLAIGRQGQNVRLSSKLTGWNLDVMTQDQHTEWRNRGQTEIEAIPELDAETKNNLLMTGFESFQDIVELGKNALLETRGIEDPDADRIYKFALDGYQNRLAEDRQRRVQREKPAPRPAPEMAAPPPEDTVLNADLGN
jgi:N utilization substance protein A